MELGLPGSELPACLWQSREETARKVPSGQKNKNICKIHVWVFGRACQPSSSELIASALAPGLALACDLSSDSDRLGGQEEVVRFQSSLLACEMTGKVVFYSLSLIFGGGKRGLAGIAVGNGAKEMPGSLADHAVDRWVSSILRVPEVLLLGCTSGLLPSYIC